MKISKTQNLISFVVQQITATFQKSATDVKNQFDIEEMNENI